MSTHLCDGAAGVAAGADEAADEAQRALADEGHDREQRAARALRTAEYNSTIGGQRAWGASRSSSGNDCVGDPQRRPADRPHDAGTAPSSRARLCKLLPHLKQPTLCTITDGLGPADALTCTKKEKKHSTTMVLAKELLARPRPTHSTPAMVWQDHSHQRRPRMPNRLANTSEIIPPAQTRAVGVNVHCDDGASMPWVHIEGRTSLSRDL